MKRLIILLLALAAWQGYVHFQSSRAVQDSLLNPDAPQSNAPLFANRAPEPEEQFHCDGRTRCSQMTSCAEAVFFLKNCPDVKMDGNNDGVPCEQQWCGQ